jgi:hypothetical protein
MNDAPLRIAMWSGPRNISTAMMRSWGNRPDTFVCDEPLYPHYLAITHRAHPGAAEVLATTSTDVQNAIDFMTGPVPGGKPIFYQKHMTHHLLPHIDRAWLRQLSNCFLIREPREVITSFIKQMPDANLADLGFTQQTEIFELVCKWTGKIPPVIDARDVQDNPRKILSALCDALNVEFSEHMLSWAPGPRDTDGIWAKYWYKDVEQSTGFRPYRAKNEPVPEHLEELLATCQMHYERLHQHRIR